ncbi:hypothetical protein [Lentzea sp. NPDC051838]|uniref:hypothetical protein n=1 Tax=Lentzea sp. NPDC051838 TaxID=3154849 RepID=UPI00342AA983
MRIAPSSAAALRRRSVLTVIFAVVLTLLGGNINTAFAAPPQPVAQQAQQPVTATASDPEEDAFNRELVQEIARTDPDPEVREAAQAALDTNDPARVLWFLDHGYTEAKAKAAERKRAEAARNRELVTEWARSGTPHVKAGAQAALDSNDDRRIADFVAYGKEIAEQQDRKDAEDEAAKRKRITDRVRDMIAAGGPQVKLEGEPILAGGDFARIEEFYLTGYAEANRRDHELQAAIEKALAERNKAITDLTETARRAEKAATARASIMRANIRAVQALDDAVTAMQLAAKAARRADQILQEDKPGRKNGQRGRDADLVALQAEAGRHAERAARAAEDARGTVASATNAAVELINSGMAHGLDWAKVTIAVGHATEAVALATETAGHAVTATLADSRALDADANAQEHADNARKWREEAQRQEQKAKELAEAAKHQLDIAVAARDRAAAQKAVAEDAARKAASHAANARSYRVNAQNAAANAFARSQAAVEAQGNAVEAAGKAQAAVDAVTRTEERHRAAIKLTSMHVRYANQLEKHLKEVRDKAIAEGRNVDEATREISAQATAARNEANASQGYADEAGRAAAAAANEARLAAAEAQRARSAALNADKEAVTARRAVDEARKLAIEASSAAAASKAAADETRTEAEASVLESNQAQFQAVITDRAASAAAASATMIIEPAARVEDIARAFAGINADARRALEAAAKATIVGEEQARSAREKATEAEQAANRAREAAERAIGDAKIAFEAAQRAAQSAEQAAKYVVSANDAANAAAEHAAGAHAAANQTARSAAVASSEAATASEAASWAASSAATAGQAAASAERIQAWAVNASNAIKDMITGINNVLDSIPDAKARWAEAQRLAKEEAQRKQDALNKEFWGYANDVLNCALWYPGETCRNFAGRVLDNMGKSAEFWASFAKDSYECSGGDQEACKRQEASQRALAKARDGIIAGYKEGLKGFLEGVKGLYGCGFQVVGAHPGYSYCQDIWAGIKDTWNNPYKLIHLDTWHEDPAKALGMTLFDVTAAAATAPLGGAGGGLSKMLSGVSAALLKATTKITKGAGKFDKVLIKVVGELVEKVPNGLADVSGLLLKVEKRVVDGKEKLVAKLEGGYTDINGSVHHVADLELDVKGDVSKLEGATAELKGGVLRLDNGVAKIDQLEFKWGEGKPLDGLDPDEDWHFDSKTDKYKAVEEGVAMYLAKEAWEKVGALHQRATRNEPAITGKFKDMIQLIPDATHAGLPQRLKGIDSLRRKAAGALKNHDGPVDPVLNSLNDVVRYTMVLPENGLSYYNGVTAGIKTLQASGLKLHPDPKNFKNRWADWETKDKYRGINTTWEDPATGQLFEVQFHTPHSLMAKEWEHKVYDQKRVLDAHPEQKAQRKAEYDQLEAKSALIFAQVAFPKNATQITIDMFR